MEYDCEGLHEDGIKGSHDGYEGMSVELGKTLMESYQKSYEGGYEYIICVRI